MLAAALAFVAGLLIGSFLNVCIYRLPRDLSVARPGRSFCPACEKTIAWYDNIPVVSYFVLGGRCRYCQARISYRYPVVELGTGLLWFYWVYMYGATPLAAKFCVLSALIVGLIFSDLEERILPDEMTVGGAVMGLAFAWFVPVIDTPLSQLMGVEAAGLRSFVYAAFSAVTPAFFLWGAGYLYQKVRKREGLGFGDVKLIAMVGAFLGLQNSLFTLIVGSIAGSVIGYGYIKLRGKDTSTYELPFGTFLGLAALAAAFLSDKV